MSEDAPRYEVAPDGQAAIEAVDGYLGRAIREGRPIEALIGTRQLGEITEARAKQAAQAATEGSWSWSDVGQALGVSKQAAHEKLRARIQDKFEKNLSKLDRAEQAGHAKIASRAKRGRDKLEKSRRPGSELEAASKRLSDWERRRHEKLTRELQKAREELARAEQAVKEKLDEEGLR
jgi:hypothetical protein